MAWEKNPYTILGVAQSATVDEIRAAYRSIARRLHPDVNPDNVAAHEQFQDVTQAHEILTNSSQRRSVDERLKREQEQSTYFFTLQVTPSKRSVVKLKESQVIYLLAEILPDPQLYAEKQKQETHLNLTLVLDQSNSMNGTRIEKVRIAAHQIIDSLSENDIISVVTFNDRADTIIAATPVKDKPALKARTSMIVPRGGTEIYKGLLAGVEENRKLLTPKMVNHVILLTDGHTFGDQDACLDLARTAATEGIGISAMGLGHDWNDKFLDELASLTGGNSEYIRSAGAVVRFLNDHVRSLSNTFADRMVLSVAVDPDVIIESAFRLSPSPQPVAVGGGIVPLGSLQMNRPVSLLMQLQLPADMELGVRSVVRLVAAGDILSNLSAHHQEVTDIRVTIVDQPTHEEPPNVILDALSKLTLYRLQERAQEALESGDTNEATRRLENLATRLLAMGQEELAQQARSEAQRVTHTQQLSDTGRKTLKYQTRHLLMNNVGEEDQE